MKIAIMQPYFLPYIGYWQLINAVDIFVVYDNIKYTKKGWINRNRFIQNGKEAIFTIPIRKDSDSLDVRDRYLADDFNKREFSKKILNAYKKSLSYEYLNKHFDSIILFPSTSLFDYILNSIQELCQLLKIRTPIIVSSTIKCDHSLRSTDRVKAIVKALGGNTYINPIGGLELYNKADFFTDGIELQFLKSSSFEYTQPTPTFIPFLSIIDLAMHNSMETVREQIHRGFELL
jgi:hypothetical protein